MASSDVFVTFGGDTGALEASISVVKAQMNALTREMKTAASEFTKTGAAADSELGQKLRSLGDKMAAAKDHMNGLKTATNAGGDAIKQMAEKVGNAAYEYGPWTGSHVQLAQVVGGSLVSAFARAGVAVSAMGLAVGGAAAASLAAVAVIASQTDGYRKLDDAARAANVSMTALKNLNTAGKGVGIEAETMNSEMAAFAVKLREAQAAGGELADFLKANNIAIKDAQGNLRPVQEIFGKIAEMVLKTNNEMDRLKTMETVGFSGETLRLIERQTEAVRVFAASTKEANVAQDALNKKMLEDGEKVSSAFSKLGAELKREINNAAVAVFDLDEKAEILIPTLDEVAASAAKAFGEIVSGARNAAGSIRAVYGELDLSAKFGGKGAQGGHDSFAGFGINAFGGWGDGSPPASAGGVDPASLYKDKDKAKASKGAKGGAGDTRKDAQEEAKAAIDAARATFEQKKSLLDEYAKLHIISTADQIAGTRIAANEEFEAQKAALEKEKKLRDLKPSQIRKINDDIQKIEAQHLKEMQKLKFQAVEDEIKDWTKMVDTMSSSMSSGLSGMIEGTKTFGQTMQSLAQGVERQFVKMGVDLVADWTKAQLANVALSHMGEAGKTAAVATGAAARGGIVASEAAVGAAVTLASVGKSIAASAAETFAGVFGFLAPVMGPAAAGPAAASEGAVLGVLGGIYDVGSWQINRDQIAAIHAGEMIVPSRGGVADEFRSFMSNGGFSGIAGGQGGGATHNHTHNWNISAIDAQGVKSFFANNSRTIMKAMDQAASHGNHLGLRRLGNL
jgi:hypothetical protein